jgi:hypothetical protein
MTLLTYVEENDQQKLKAHLSYLLKSWSESVLSSKAKYDSAEQVMYFFILDLMTTLAYSLKANPVRHQELIDYMYNIMSDVKEHNNER